MSRWKVRLTLKEVQMLVRPAQEEGTRLILELEPDGRFRIIFSEEETVKAGEDIVLW